MFCVILLLTEVRKRSSKSAATTAGKVGVSRQFWIAQNAATRGRVAIALVQTRSQ